MSFTDAVVQIAIKGEAFVVSPELEVAHLLRVAADKIENGADSGILKDINGNTVGTFRLSDHGRSS